jgi:hypothetical protein
VLKDATTYFLCSTPNLATVIPAMDHIDEKFTTDSRNKQYHSAICASLSTATLDAGRIIFFKKILEIL